MKQFNLGFNTAIYLWDITFYRTREEDRDLFSLFQIMPSHMIYSYLKRNLEKESYYNDNI